MKKRVDSGQVPLVGGLGPAPTSSATEKFGAHGRVRGPGVLGAAADAVATYLGITPAELRTELESGKTLAQIATAHNKTADGVVTILLGQAKQKLDKAVSAGILTAAKEQTRAGPSEDGAHRRRQRQAAEAGPAAGAPSTAPSGLRLRPARAASAASGAGRHPPRGRASEASSPAPLAAGGGTLYLCGMGDEMRPSPDPDDWWAGPATPTPTVLAPREPDEDWLAPAEDEPAPGARLGASLAPRTRLLIAAGIGVLVLIVLGLALGGVFSSNAPTPAPPTTPPARPPLPQTTAAKTPTTPKAAAVVGPTVTINPGASGQETKSLQRALVQPGPRSRARSTAATAR